MHWFLKFIFGIKLYMFRAVPLSIMRSFSLYTQQWYMSYRFADSLRARQRNFLKHVEFYSKNKFEKSVHLIGFIIRIYFANYCIWWTKELSETCRVLFQK